MELVFRTKLLDDDPTEVSVDSSYLVSTLNDEVRADIELIVEDVTERNLHGGSPNLFGLIWSAVRSVYPSAVLVRMDKPDPGPEPKRPPVF